MAKVSKVESKFVCIECGGVVPKWMGKCPVCGKFGTIQEELQEAESASVQSFNAPAPRPVKLDDIEKEKLIRFSSGIKELDVVLGGGIVPSSIVLIGGDPGIGKSTILTEVAGFVAKTQKVLYVSAEESLSQVKLRCLRLGVNADNLMILNENRLENIEAAADDFDFLVVDSIQAVYLSELTGSAGSVGQIKECAAKLMRLAKTKRKTVFIIGHVTKDGAIAGPKVLEHIMDAVLYFEGDESSTKLLRAVKNRFGSVQEVGVFEMTEKGIKGVSDYSGIFMSENRGAAAGSIVAPSMSGNRCVPVEIQSLISKTVFGMPRRMPVGVDYNRTAMIIAVLERKCYIPFYNQDVYLNAMGGIKLSEPATDLAIALSLASSVKNVPIDKAVAAFGEIGLTGEVRGCAMAEKRVSDLIKLGFKKVIVPKRNFDAVKKFAGDIEIVPVNYLFQAVKALFGDASNDLN